MSSKPHKKNILDHIEKMCLVEAEKLLTLGYEYQALTSLVLGMEWFGALIDDKPSGAKKQSRKRFERALRRLPPVYWEKHLEVDLYKQLRNRTVHNPWVNSQYLLLTSDKEKHLMRIGETIQFNVATFQKDFAECFSSKINTLDVD